MGLMGQAQGEWVWSLVGGQDGYRAQVPQHPIDSYRYITYKVLKFQTCRTATPSFSSTFSDVSISSNICVPKIIRCLLIKLTCSTTHVLLLCQMCDFNNTSRGECLIPKQAQLKPEVRSLVPFYRAQVPQPHRLMQIHITY